MMSKVFSYIFNILKPYRLYTLGFLISGLIWALLNAFTPYLLKILIDHAVQYKGTMGAFSHLQNDILLYALAWFFICMNMRFSDYLKLQTFPSLRYDVMSSQFAYLNLHEYNYFQNHFAGNLTNKIIELQGSLIDIIEILNNVYSQFLGITIACILLSVVHPLFALVLIIWIVVFLTIILWFLRPIEYLSLLFAHARSAVVGNMVDSISNIVNVRLFARNDYENQIMNQKIVDSIQKDRQMIKKIIKMHFIGDLTILIFLLVNLFIIGKLYETNQLTIGDFTFIITLSISILWNIWGLSGHFVDFAEKIGRCKQSLAIIDQAHGIVDAPNAKPLKVNQGKIEFSDVSFHYNHGLSLFKNKSIVIQPGQKVGLVGPSGSGKSTFLNLILRLYELESGQILIDGQNISQVTQNSLRENISFIPQETSLFHRSIMDNIRYGNPEASDQQVIEVAKLAHAHEFITLLPAGYETIVGERGVKLSGGQKQRIAIARALLKNAPILMLDEATSALDTKTERYIQDSLHVLMQNKTTIVIAHRLSTLTEMDRILVFNQGQIVEDGSHLELLKQNSHYAKLWSTQVSGFIF